MSLPIQQLDATGTRTFHVFAGLGFCKLRSSDQDRGRLDLGVAVLLN